MVGKDYCAIVRKLEVRHSIKTGDNIRVQARHTFNLVGGCYRAVPGKLYS